VFHRTQPSSQAHPNPACTLVCHVDGMSGLAHAMR